MVYKCPKCGMTTADPDDVARRHCPFCELFAENSVPAVVERDRIPELAHLLGGRDLTRRQCFSVAAVALLHFGKPDSRLVHGWVRNSFDPLHHVLHAWVETSGLGEFLDDSTGQTVNGPVTVVIDYTQADERARVMERDRYYEQLGVRTDPPPKRYTREEMIRTMFQYGHDGPWEAAGDRGPP
jgi:hypothetical protein